MILKRIVDDCLRDYKERARALREYARDYRAEVTDKLLAVGGYIHPCLTALSLFPAFFPFTLF